MHQRSETIRVVLLTSLFGIAQASYAAEDTLDRSGAQWTSLFEWNLVNDSFTGNPYDLQATATFVHEPSGETRNTGMYYIGGKTWSFRFTATRPGRWTFTTKSADTDLDGRRGVVTIEPSADAYGFVTHLGNKWTRQTGSEGQHSAFVPQYVMFGHPGTFHRRPDLIERNIQVFINQHGFTGFHVPVYCRWFDIDQERSRDIKTDDPNPDPRTFEALELLITKVHAAGGVIHLWAWGDESRTQTPAKWEINGKADKRLQRYIAARLGPIPGWTMGYGFDLWEWVDGDQLAEWYRHMHAQFGWPHMLGARASTNQLNQLCESLDYSSYEQHRPDQATYVKTIRGRPNKPSFSEDRFRIRQSERYRNKDYTEEMTRRGLWHSTMAGGVANIWGRLDGDLDINMGRGMSKPYEHPERMNTYATFFRDRFRVDMSPDNSLSDGVCLRDTGATRFVFYKEDADSIRIDLSAMRGMQPAVAVDARQPYHEIVLGDLTPQQHTWAVPHRSDWAIAVGQFPAQRPAICELTPFHAGVCQMGKDHVLGEGYSSDQRMPFVIYSFLVNGPHGEKALVDLGPKTVEYCNRMFRIHGLFRDMGMEYAGTRRYPDDIIQPHGNVLAQLERLGIAPAQIDHVVFTHLHADHHGMDDATNGGAAEDFERATLHVSANGWKDNRAKRKDGKWNSYVDFAFSDYLERRNGQGKVHFHDNALVFPGLRTVYLGGHSECSQAVIVETADGPAILASDEIYLYQLLEVNILPQIRTSENRYRRAVGRLIELAESRNGILIPMHDPLVWEVYERSGEDWLKELRKYTQRAIAKYR